MYSSLLQFTATSTYFRLSTGPVDVLLTFISPVEVLATPECLFTIMIIFRTPGRRPREVIHTVFIPHCAGHIYGWRGTQRKRLH